MMMNDVVVAAEKPAAVNFLDGLDALTPDARRQLGRDTAAAAAVLLELVGGATEYLAAVLEADGGEDAWEDDLFAMLDTAGELSCGLSAGAALRAAAGKLRGVADAA